MTELLSSGAFLHAEHGDEAGGMQKLRKELENETVGDFETARLGSAQTSPGTTNMSGMFQ